MVDPKLKSTFHSAKEIAFKQITELGSFMAYIFFIPIFFILGYNDLALTLFISLVIVMTVANLIKYFYFKERPVKRQSRNLAEKLDAASFPSIHSMRTFSLVFWISMYFNDIILSSYLAIVGMIVIYSRVYLKTHYWKDVIFGILFSLIINLVLWWAL